MVYTKLKMNSNEWLFSIFSTHDGGGERGGRSRNNPKVSDYSLLQLNLLGGGRTKCYKLVSCSWFSASVVSGPGDQFMMFCMLYIELMKTYVFQIKCLSFSFRLLPLITASGPWMKMIPGSMVSNLSIYIVWVVHGSIAYAVAGLILTCNSMGLGCLVPVDWRWFMKFPSINLKLASQDIASTEWNRQ